MKEYRVKPSKAAVTSIDVAGRPHHYFQSEKLGKCRAIVIAPPHSEKSHVDMVNEEIDLAEQESAKKAEKPQKNTLSKGQRLEILMECGKRISARVDRYFKAYLAATDRDSKKVLWDKVRAAEKASNRVSRKMVEMLES